MSSPNVIELTENNWNEHVTSGTLVVADFWAPWCGPCRHLSPVIDKVADQFAGKVKVGKLNVDENPNIAVKYDVMTIPRILFFPQPLEIYQSPQRMFMFFERDHAWRQIWTDGRSHPSAMEPTWMGDSIGKWEGDTFVVDTIGLTEKSWLDFYGDPHSDDIHLVERFKRVDHDTLTLQLIVEDPKAYTATWVGDTKIYKLLKGKKAYMEELPCIPEEEDAFTNRIRMPAASQTPKQ